MSGVVIAARNGVGVTNHAFSFELRLLFNPGRSLILRPLQVGRCLLACFHISCDSTWVLVIVWQCLFNTIRSSGSGCGSSRPRHSGT